MVGQLMRKWCYSHNACPIMLAHQTQRFPNVLDAKVYASVKTSPKNVFCTYCSNNKGKRYYFCWECKKEWKGSPSNKECGNDRCSQEEVLEKLKNCPLKDIQYLKGLQAPSIRACPTCGTLIEHADKCKHVTCKVCKVEFCFVCLRICSEGSSFCGRYYTPCKVADRQTKIPRRPNS